MQPRTVHIYWAHHERHLPPVSEAGLHLSAHVQRRWKQYRTAQQQSMSLLAKRLLLYGLKQRQWRTAGGLADFSHHPNGKPFLARLPVYFSLSHSNCVAVCALSTDEPVGIDVQQQLAMPPRSEGFFLAADEQRQLPGENRLVLWCGKEAAYKAMGHELNARLTDFQFARPERDGPYRIACPPASLELFAQATQPDYLCYLAVPVRPSPEPVCITTERVLYPYE